MPTGALAAVAGVEVETLERALKLLRPEAGAGVLDPQLARRRDDPDGAARGRQAQCVLDQVRDDLQRSVGVAGRPRVVRAARFERHAEVARLALVPTQRLARDRIQIDPLPANAELRLAHAREIEHVADEPLEATRLGDDRRRRLVGGKRSVLQAFRVASDRGQRRLQLVADREQEGALRLACLRELDGHLVEALCQQRQLARALDRDERRLPGGARQPARRLGHPAHRPRDRAGEQERDQRCEGGGRGGGEDQPLDVWAPGRVRRARRAQQHEALPVHEAGRVEVARSVRLDGAVEPDAAPHLRRAIGREQLGGAVQLHPDDALVLPADELLQRPEVREGQDRLALALDEQVELGRDVPQRVPLDGPASQDRAQRQGKRQREQGDECDRCEEPRPQRRQSHGRSLTA